MINPLPGPVFPDFLSAFLLSITPDSLITVYDEISLMFIIGHRGARALAPENTLLAVRTGMQCADFVEVDVRLSADGVPVIMHDETVNRTTNGTGPVHGYTLHDLKLLNAGEGEQIPTLEEVCHQVKEECGLVVEIKEPGSEAPVCTTLRRNPPRDLVIVSFHPESITAARALIPGVRTGIISSHTALDLPALAGNIGADMLLPRFDLVTREMITECRGWGLPVIAWTLNTEDAFRMAEDLGIDGFATDDPCAAGKFFGRSKHGLPGGYPG